MPFKTRKRKESAKERRYAFIENKQSFSLNKVVYQGADKARSSYRDHVLVTPDEGKKIEEVVNTGSDLLKIVAAASVIVAVQVVLSLTLR
ncbi:hypothetical protein A2870_00370 [Candidatus Curtissbacteria bacterium RIFCSPHIGHO2_01_FULL_41_11]|uniref:Uncharacterized protein n=1 Tax=Candidatus Curtissbacteria bacterium RIFCSPHIGHO2_01_FULL_41_11 TaxID=1797711 RepID=A0A1F5G538_9BACT|nr:MAG: hypothetical protein A2870_00370 [Candidatus Curtissbacteria bacterium RIFCSPHIGHO2_01_FULL_41_11]